ncbi:MAG TPA: hypothetical protein VHZ74_27280 [Bryobacteraceae bacterium]|nr:hypothetical protein [Bryobacteraceae bacterium]
MTTGFVVNHLWQSSFFAALAGLLAFVLRENAAKVRSSIWLSASLKFLVPFALLASLGNLIQRPVQHVVSAPAPVFSNSILQIAEPFSSPSSSAVRAHNAVHWAPILLGIVWAAGFAIITSLRCRDWFRIRAALRAGTRVELPLAVPALISPAPGNRALSVFCGPS